MLLTLLNPKSQESYNTAIEQIRKAYLTGKFTVNEKSTDLPFTAQWNILFPNGETGNNTGHFNHFCNVTAATAHIINYAESGKISLGEFTLQRKLDNMMVAFYHDIGKTIIPRRHGVEGKALFAEPKASVKFRFEEIAKHYTECEITSATLSYYAELIGYHDIFGTISTGENGLLSLANIIKRFADIFNNDKIAIKNAVYDLWLLNLADIITSISFLNGRIISKFDVQNWQLNIPGNLDNDIDWFLNSSHGRYLKEDLQFALQIAESENYYPFAKSISENRSAHRLQRLAQQTFANRLTAKDKSGNYAMNFPEDLREAILNRLSDSSLTLQVKEILRSEFGDNYGKYFGTMLQFDYALGFFEMLSAQAIHWINEELKPDSTFRTGWLYNQKISKTQNYNKDYINRYNAECVVNNYIMVIAGIFGEIYRLTSDIEHWNVEFEDAKNRLTPSKADKLLFFDGAYRASNARNLLMKEIMLYKS
jgi:hypothetical protein